MEGIVCCVERQAFGKNDITWLLGQDHICTAVLYRPLNLQVPFKEVCMRCPDLDLNVEEAIIHNNYAFEA